ncbi:MAG: argininosuccinate lyase [Candidatus Omnitrophica bacterium]|nr:argininosuccinate lyase [Candidatus Omnitrophota bacterium]
MKKLWGGRFAKEAAQVLKEFSYSFLVDSELLEAELSVNRAYARMLARIKLISRLECASLLRGLDKIERAWKPGDACRYFETIEDVHTFIQQELERIAGPVGKKIHTGRSRNDLVITSTLIYLRGKLTVLDEKIKGVELALVDCAHRSQGAVIPGFTHLKKAQPVLLAHHLLAYVELLDADRARLKDALGRMNALPLGSGSLAGSALPIDRAFLAKELGFKNISANSMATVADRSFAVEILAALAILWMHLSRLSEDFILWNSEPFRFVELDDAFATGSSLMPQKKNPDVFELVRGRTGVIFGHLMSILTIQKGLPMTYNRDLQEDKPGLFDALRKTKVALEVLQGTLSTCEFNQGAMAQAVEEDGLYATDILEYLVRKGMPFAEAHETVGKVVRSAASQKRSMKDLTLEEWRQFSGQIGGDIHTLFDPQVSVSAKKTVGSTQPILVRKELARWKAALGSRTRARKA